MKIPLNKEENFESWDEILEECIRIVIIGCSIISIIGMICLCIYSYFSLLEFD